MNRVFFSALLAALTAPALAHVSHTQGAAHAAEHLWLLLLLAPAIGLARPLVRKLIRIRKP